MARHTAKSHKIRKVEILVIQILKLYKNMILNLHLELLKKSEIILQQHMNCLKKQNLI